MRKVLAVAAVASLALSFGSASAIAVGGPNELPNSCLIAGGESTPAPGGKVTCTFQAADVPMHGYGSMTPNSFVIFIDVDGDGNFDAEDTELVNVPTESFSKGGTLNIPAGTTVTVSVEHECVPMTPVCGWVGWVAAG